MRHSNPKKKNIVILGDMSNKDGFGVGQFVNDAAMPEICEDDKSFLSTLQILEKYEKQSFAKANCQVNEQLWFTATKDIEANEELFTHYGVDFWIHKLLVESNDPKSRLLIYSMHNQETKPFNLRNFVKFDEATCKVFTTVLLGVPEESLCNYKSAKEYLFQMMVENGSIGEPK